MDIKSVIRDYSLRNYVVNVQYLKTCKLLNVVLKSLKTRGLTQIPRQHLGNKLPRSDAHEPLSRTFFQTYYSFDKSGRFRTFIYFKFGVLLQEN